MNANFKIFHPHNSEAVEISIKNVEIIDNYPFILHVIYNIKDNNMDIYPVIYDDEFDETFDKSYYDSRIKDNLVILAPDAGAFKWISKLCDKLNWKGQLASASKSRKYENNQSKLIQIINEQDFNGKDVLLIDDICIKGGSAIGLAKILKTKNVRKLYAAFSHMTVDSPNPELFELFDYIYTTNSKDLSYIDTRTEGFPKNLLIIKQF
jgi:phosphoribosylpyrophosphate synthetase